MTITALIIDDEELARELIKSYLKEFTFIEVVGECSNGFEGLKSINELKPDLVFLDIQMPKLTGFEMLELLDDKPFIIFTTAYNEFAIKAFESNAVDYLLKPFSLERFQSALNKVTERIKNNEKSEPVSEKLVAHVAESQETIERVVVKTGNKIHVITTDKIFYLESQDDYVMIYTESGKHLKHQTMKYFESHLDPSEFIRIHRGYLVRIPQIAQLEQFGKESYVLVLKSGTKLPVSKSGYSRLKEVLNF
jgi:two-component system, LytTR family, response regulator